MFTVRSGRHVDEQKMMSPYYSSLSKVSRLRQNGPSVDIRRLRPPIHGITAPFRFIVDTLDARGHWECANLTQNRGI